VLELENFYEQQRKSCKEGKGLEMFTFLDNTKEAIQIFARNTPCMLAPLQHKPDNYSFHAKYSNVPMQALERINNGNDEFDDIVVMNDVVDFDENWKLMPHTFVDYVCKHIDSLCYNPEYLCDKYELKTGSLYRAWHYVYWGKFWEE
jgi:hypothetical protein